MREEKKRLHMSELLFAGGIAVMAASAVGILSALVIFRLTGRRIRRKLEQEYGKAQKT